MYIICLFCCQAFLTRHIYITWLTISGTRLVPSPSLYWFNCMTYLSFVCSHGWNCLTSVTYGCHTFLLIFFCVTFMKMEAPFVLRYLVLPMMHFAWRGVHLRVFTGKITKLSAAKTPIIVSARLRCNSGSSIDWTSIWGSQLTTKSLLSIFTSVSLVVLSSKWASWNTVTSGSIILAIGRFTSEKRTPPLVSVTWHLPKFSSTCHK